MHGWDDSKGQEHNCIEIWEFLTYVNWIQIVINKTFCQQYAHNMNQLLDK